jgi:hypothetical protein
MKQVIFKVEHTYRSNHFTPAAGITTIDSDKAIAWAELGLLTIVGDGCGCGNKVEVSPGVMMDAVTNNPNRPALPEDDGEEIEEGEIVATKKTKTKN